jgi:hypothetical protein
MKSDIGRVLEFNIVVAACAADVVVLRLNNSPFIVPGGVPGGWTSNLPNK